MAASQGRRTGETVFTEAMRPVCRRPPPVDHGTEGMFRQGVPDFSQM